MPVLGHRFPDGGHLTLPLGLLRLEEGLEVGYLCVAGRDVAVDEAVDDLALLLDHLLFLLELLPELLHSLLAALLHGGHLPLEIWGAIQKY